MRAYYTNALPLDLLKEEQDRISSQEESARAELSAAVADLDKWQEALSLAIRLAGSCPRRLSQSPPEGSRPLQLGVLQAVYIKDRQLQRAEFTEVFEAPFLAPESQ